MRYFIFPVGFLLILLIPAPLLLLLSKFFEQSDLLRDAIITAIATGIGAYIASWFVWHKTQEEKQEEILRDMNCVSAEIIMLSKRLKWLKEDLLEPCLSDVDQIGRNYLEYKKTGTPPDLEFPLFYILKSWSDISWDNKSSFEVMKKYAGYAPALLYDMKMLDIYCEQIGRSIVVRNEEIDLFAKQAIASREQICSRFPIGSLKEHDIVMHRFYILTGRGDVLPETRELYVGALQNIKECMEAVDLLLEKEIYPEMGRLAVGLLDKGYHENLVRHG